MKHEEYILALKQWQIADSMVQSLAGQFDVLDNSNPDKCGKFSSYLVQVLKLIKKINPLWVGGG